MASCSILVVEDDTVIREILVMILKEEDLLVTSAATVAETFSHVERRATDLVILDLIIPGANGPTMINEIRLRSPDLRILAMSASPSALAIAASHGADDVLAKPFEIEELLDKVTRLCRAEAKSGPFERSPTPA